MSNHCNHHTSFKSACFGCIQAVAVYQPVSAVPKRKVGRPKKTVVIPDPSKPNLRYYVLTTLGKFIHDSHKGHNMDDLEQLGVLVIKTNDRTVCYPLHQVISFEIEDLNGEIKAEETKP